MISQHMELDGRENRLAPEEVLSLNKDVLKKKVYVTKMETFHTFLKIDFQHKIKLTLKNFTRNSEPYFP